LNFGQSEIQPLLCPTISFLKSFRVVDQRLKDGSWLSHDQSRFSAAYACKLLSLSHPFIYFLPGFDLRHRD
jgi:hypothetical protein